jgi:cytochrome b
MSGIKLSMRVWDAPVRLFHWLLAALVVALYVSQYLDRMWLHYRLGEVTLSLLIFRLLWGFWGSDTARFAHFLARPSAAFAHLAGFRSAKRSENAETIGHNPAGGWMVVVLLLLLFAQALSGLFARADQHSAGPLNHYLDKSASDLVSTFHSWNFYALLAAIIVHLIAIAAYAVWRGEDLVRPMISGKKRLPAATRAPRLASSWLAFLLYLVAGAIVAVAVTR